MLLIKMKSKLVTRSLLMLALTSLLVLQVIKPVHAVPTTTGYITVYIVNTKNDRATLVGTTGSVTFTIYEVGEQAYVDYWIPASKGNIYKFFYRNYGATVGCLVDSTSLEIFEITALHGPKQLEVFIEVDSLAGYTDLQFNVYVIPPS